MVVTADAAGVCGLAVRLGVCLGLVQGLVLVQILAGVDLEQLHLKLVVLLLVQTEELCTLSRLLIISLSEHRLILRLDSHLLIVVA